jgi:hypothetical protein
MGGGLRSLVPRSLKSGDLFGGGTSGAGGGSPQRNGLEAMLDGDAGTARSEDMKASYLARGAVCLMIAGAEADGRTGFL